MAGAGFKDFNSGDVLTASDVDTYLMQQTVMVFDDAAARTTALTGVVAEGMLSYLKDTNAVEVYDGSSWVASDDPNAIQNSIVDAKGDLISATADNTPARLAVGADNTVLTADSSTATGLKWAAAAGGGGKILQVVSTTTTATFSSSSTSYIDITGLTLSITPSAATSKIMIFYVVSGQGRDTGVTFATQLVRGSTAISLGDAAAGKTQCSSATSRPSNGNDVSSMVVNFLDSPSTTSATTYKVQGIGTGATWYVNTGENDGFRFTSSITAFEIGA